jgi:hypothetical protein
MVIIQLRQLNYMGIELAKTRKATAKHPPSSDKKDTYVNLLMDQQPLWNVTPAHSQPQKLAPAAGTPSFHGSSPEAASRPAPGRPLFNTNNLA